MLLGGEEIQYIVDNLFVGNKLSSAELLTSDELRIDLRNIRSPIVCFCSKGDSITPSLQALGWILDLYDSIDDIRALGVNSPEDERRAVDAIPILLEGHQDQGPELFEMIRQIATAGDPLGEEAERRLAEIQNLFEPNKNSSPKKKRAPQHHRCPVEKMIAGASFTHKRR